MASESFDKIPVKVKRMLAVLMMNGMLPVGETTSSKGRSMEDPIVIGLKDDNVPLEYLIVAFLLGKKEKRFLLQSLLCDNGRYYDRLDYEVKEDDGSVHEESFYFDITVGFKRW